MIDTYIYLTEEQQTKLRKTALNKQLSLSTYINIICKYYIYLLTEEEQTKYINKGKIKVHIKLQAKTYKADSVKITNCVNKFLTMKLDHVNRRIQSEADKTYDPNYLKNIIIRNTYHNVKELQK